MQASTFMQLALDQAEQAFARDEVPIGAVIVNLTTQQVVAACGNDCYSAPDITGHAELLAIRHACQQLNVPRLIDCAMFVTLEPCPMCAQAISFARLKQLYIAARDEKGGGVWHGPQIFSQHTCFHRPDIIHLDEFAAASSTLLKKFFKQKRNGA